MPDDDAEVRAQSINQEELEAELTADLDQLMRQIYDTGDDPERVLVRRYLRRIEPGPADDRRRVRIPPS